MAFIRDIAATDKIRLPPLFAVREAGTGCSPIGAGFGGNLGCLGGDCLVLAVDAGFECIRCENAAFVADANFDCACTGGAGGGGAGALRGCDIICV